MKILFYFGHPAQYLFLRETIKRLNNTAHIKTIVLIKTKDVLESLIKSDGITYKNILPKPRGKSYLSVVLSFLKRLFLTLPHILKTKPDLLVSTDAPTAIWGKILNIHRITITEDDYDVIKNLARITYPITETILCPNVCNVGKFDEKKIGYDGYMKLAYLHPHVFSPDSTVSAKYALPQKFVLIRLARLTAFHDFGASGITGNLLKGLIEQINRHGYIPYISSEEVLAPEYEPYHLKIDPSDMHSILSLTSLLISDSQSMSVEAAMLGIPSIRCSSFTGKISVLEELEHEFGLTYGIVPSHSDNIVKKVDELLQNQNLKVIFSNKKNHMLNNKINVSDFLTWFLVNYPQSRNEIKQNPLLMDRFKNETLPTAT